MRFFYTYFRPSIPVPLLLVRLGLPGQNLSLGPMTKALVDTGASWSLFPASMGRELGIEIESGRSERVQCTNGQTMLLYIHTMRVAFEFDQADIEVGFIASDRWAIIGRVSILDRYKLTFDHTFGPSFEIALLPSQRPVPGWRD